ncbi:hypothetical protein P7C70_g8374, partial [Phenoliferia sp. Uapishka_3]
WKEDDGEGEGEEELGGEWKGKALIKPDIVFFGEMLSNEFDRRLLEDREQVDLLIVIGTSLRVRFPTCLSPPSAQLPPHISQVSPVAQIVSHLPHSVPQILINRDPITHANFDVHLLGSGDTIVEYLCQKLAERSKPSPPLSSGWDLDERVPRKSSGVENGKGKEKSVVEDEEADWEPERVAGSHVWLFPGANGGRWVEAVRSAFEDSSSGGEEGSAGEGGENGNGNGNGLEVPNEANGKGGENSRSRTRSPDGSERGEERKKVRLE